MVLIMTKEHRDMLLSNMNTNLTNQAREINELSSKYERLIGVVNSLIKNINIEKEIMYNYKIILKDKRASKDKLRAICEHLMNGLC